MKFKRESSNVTEVDKETDRKLDHFYISLMPSLSLKMGLL